MTKKVLIIDNDLGICEVIKIILEERGYDVFFVNDGRRIFQKVKKSSPEIILLDLWMSGESGEMIVKKLKSHKKTQKIPIILISASTEVDKIAKDIHVNDFLAKPFDIEDLVAVVKRNIT